MLHSEYCLIYGLPCMKDTVAQVIIILVRTVGDHVFICSAKGVECLASNYTHAVYYSLSMKQQLSLVPLNAQSFVLLERAPSSPSDKFGSSLWRAEKSLRKGKFLQAKIWVAQLFDVAGIWASWMHCDFIGESRCRRAGIPPRNWCYSSLRVQCPHYTWSFSKLGNIPVTAPRLGSNPFLGCILL